MLTFTWAPVGALHTIAGALLLLPPQGSFFGGRVEIHAVPGRCEGSSPITLRGSGSPITPNVQ